jgi:hypothetical protein
LPDRSCRSREQIGEARAIRVGSRDHIFRAAAVTIATIESALELVADADVVLAQELERFGRIQ